MDGSPRYTLQEQLHDGPHAVIHRGVLVADGAPVVVKLLKGDYPSPRALAQLRREYETLRAIDLPGVIKAHALEPHGNGLALIMADTGGVPLSAVLRGRPLPLRLALEIALSVARTLAELHQRSIVHKDIKPHNILLGPGAGEVKLIDFGIAMRLHHEHARPASPDAIEGTLMYMSPEQSGRVNRVVDPRTDLYSLGVTLYELLTGSLPFTASDPLELIHSHIARAPAPPRTRAPEVPQVVSDIVLRLLAKAPEDRYQHALGLAADLATCLDRLDAAGDVAPFALATRDLPDTLRLPQKLYGREPELAALMAAYARIQRGRPELVLITGNAGVGKSALVLEVHKAIARGGGRLVAGKFDLLQRSTPYGALSRALGELVRQVLGGSPTALADWRTRVRAALGANARLLVDIVPELALIVGPQPEVPRLRPTEAQHRFHLAFQDFARACSEPGAPLVLFLDDLQWADAASLTLLRRVLTDPNGADLLIVGAFRYSDVDACHALTNVLAELRQDGVPRGDLHLRDLGLADVRAYLADCLGRDDDALAGLADLAFTRTHGNPFFLGQFVLALQERGLLRLDRAAARWTWDAAAIAAAPFTANVVDFMAEKVRELPADTRRLLAVAACIGDEFEVTTLARAADLGLGRAAADLWPALRAGLVVPLDADYRLLADDAGADDALADTLAVTCRFLHDRVHQAALVGLPADDRVLAHLRIGRSLLAGHPGELRGDALFAVVRHLDAGATAISDPAERLDLARRNLAAGRAAKAATAHAAAIEFLSAGVDLLPANAWDDEHDLTYALRRELAETFYLTAQFEPADVLFTELQARARTLADKADLVCMRMVLLSSAGRFHAGVEAARAGLALFGDTIPPPDPDAWTAAFGALLASITTRMQGRTIESLIDAPTLTDPDLRARGRMLGDLFFPAFLLDPRLGAVIILKEVDFALEHGHDLPSAHGYTSYAYILSGPLGNQRDALRFGELALHLLERYPSPPVAARVHFMFGFIVGHLRPIRTALPHFRRATVLGLEVGELMFAAQGAVFEVMTGLRIGDDLASLHEPIARAAAILQRTGDVLSSSQLPALRNLVDALEHRTWWGAPLTEDSPEEAAFLARVDTHGLVVVRIFHLIQRLVACALFGEHAVASRLIAALTPILPLAVGAPYTVDVPFYAALTAAALADRDAAIRECTAQRDVLAVWAANCPDNEQHRLHLLDAELARLRGDDLAAMDHYDRAIELARKHGFQHHEALAGELCGEFHLARRRATIARAYLAQARHGYERWGAAAKVRDLEARHPFLIARGEAPAHGATTGRSHDSGSLSTTGRQGLDLATVIKAAQAFTMEIELQPLLEQIVRITVENAGARRGVLLIDHDGHLCVAAESSADTGPYTLRQPIPLTATDTLPTSVIHYVAHTMDCVILDDAARDPRFGADPYVDARAIRSVLCVPLVSQAHLVGVLYLENDLTQGVFSAARLEAIQLIATHAAISIENANLYADMERRVHARTDELSRVNQSLTASNAELDAFARTVAHDLMNPLGAIAGYSEHLLENLEQLPHDEAEKIVDNIRRATATAASIVDELLLLAGVRKQQVQTTALDMAALVERVQQRMAFMLRAHDGRLALPDGWPAAVGYAPWIEEAWINYISNGLKYGSPDLELGHDALPDGALRFWVRDHGPGIPPEQQARLFAEFTRLDAVRTDGYGLGLSIVRRIVERLGGRVGVDSTPGAGSVFWFTLPAA